MFTPRTMEVAGCPHNYGDVLNLDGERWVVTKTNYNGSWSKVWLEPLFVFVSRNVSCSQVRESDMCILDYLKKLCDEYDESCCC